ncbi:MAG TPA: c-type cytochrome [Terriglobales bacterium]|nr:c-type cytochrome [Terriglobales bacterium]
MSTRFHFALLLSFAGALLLMAGCTGGKELQHYSVVTGGDEVHGKELILNYRCGACHIIPGINGADGMVGPPLILFADRTMVGGELPNTPDNLVRWIVDPPSIEPGTAMPNLGLTDKQARDVAAYLYTLR